MNSRRTKVTFIGCCSRALQKQLRRNDAFVEKQLSRIAAIPRNGFAVSRGDWVPEVNAVAAPVWNPSHQLIAGLQRPKHCPVNWVNRTVAPMIFRA
jgi:hypothetical protein